MIPILDCVYGKFKCFFRVQKEPKLDLYGDPIPYKGCTKSKEKRDRKAKEECWKDCKESFSKPD